jgi:hypothetical protein
MRRRLDIENKRIPSAIIGLYHSERRPRRREIAKEDAKNAEEMTVFLFLLVASRQVIGGVFRFSHRQQGCNEELIAQAGRPGIDRQTAHFADRSPAFRPGLLKRNQETEDHARLSDHTARLPQLGSGKPPGIRPQATGHSAAKRGNGTLV